MESLSKDSLKRLSLLFILFVTVLVIHMVNHEQSYRPTGRSFAPVYQMPDLSDIMPTEPQFYQTRDDLKNISLRLTQRHDHIDKTCKKHSQRIRNDQIGIKNSKVYQKYYAKQQRVIIDVHTKVAICLQAKGGSSFWKGFFMHRNVTEKGLLFKEDSKTSGIQFVSLESFKSMVDSLVKQNYTMYTFGRNPWTRLVSLYRQKIETKSNTSKENKYIRAACLKRPYERFVDMLRCVVRTTRDLKLPDRHWEPLSTRCGLCQIPYNFIGKVEYMNEEASHILYKAGIAGNISDYLETVRDHSIREVEKGHVSQHIDYSSYYRDIPPELIESLRGVYRSDLDLLGYPYSPT